MSLLRPPGWPGPARYPEYGIPGENPRPGPLPAQRDPFQFSLQSQVPGSGPTMGPFHLASFIQWLAQRKPPWGQNGQEINQQNVFPRPPLIGYDQTRVPPYPNGTGRGIY